MSRLSFDTVFAFAWFSKYKILICVDLKANFSYGRNDTEKIVETELHNGEKF